ncbi:MAG: AAA family ATPase [Planctomycetota bacterium]|jgi:MoxR-like ATPase
MREKVAQLEKAIGAVFLGKPKVIRHVLTGLFAQGHILLEDVPGVGKTLLARTLAQSIDASFKRLQFTPDLLPSDLLGTTIFNQKNGDFEFRPGPIFAHVVLADEINRTTPRTQSALLEAMNVANVSIDGVTHRLPNPFLVIATQNPLEFEGTYPLPESQLDRFLLRLSIGYPSRADENEILSSQQLIDPLDEVRPVIHADDVAAIQKQVRGVKIEQSVRDFIVAVVAATRESRRLRLGVSTRGAGALQRAAQAHAYLDGRDFVIPDDVKRLCGPVLAHRVMPEGGLLAEASHAQREKLIEEILESVEVPI